MTNVVVTWACVCVYVCDTVCDIRHQQYVIRRNVPCVFVCVISNPRHQQYVIKRNVPILTRHWEDTLLILCRAGIGPE